MTHLSVVLPTFNERENISPLLRDLLAIEDFFEVEVLVVDDDSTDGTPELVKEISKKDHRIRLISRLGRSGLASAIKEGLLAANGDIVAVMDADGQHKLSDVINACRFLIDQKSDIVVGSRFIGDATISGLSRRRTKSSSIANKISRFSLPSKYSHLTDYMSGCFVLNFNNCYESIRKVNVNGFKFFYELLAVSQGRLIVSEVPLAFQPRFYGESKLDFSILWDFVISILHTMSFRVVPRRAISFGIVGATGCFVQLMFTKFFMEIAQLGFERSIAISAVIAAISNYLINNLLTFRSNKLKGFFLLKGVFKYLLVSSLPVIANVGIATAFYNTIVQSAFWAQMAGILLAFVWNYAASSRFVWNTP